METTKSATPIDEGEIDDRRGSVDDRRSSPRKKVLRGAQIFWPTGAAVVWPTGAAVRCVVRNFSEEGAKIEVSSPVPETFELLFDCDQSRRSCRVIWRKKNQIGVRFT